MAFIADCYNMRTEPRGRPTKRSAAGMFARERLRVDSKLTAEAVVRCGQWRTLAVPPIGRRYKPGTNQAVNLASSPRESPRSANARSSASLASQHPRVVR